MDTNPGFVLANRPRRQRASLPPGALSEVLPQLIKHNAVSADSAGSPCLNPRYLYLREIYRSEASPTVVELYHDTDTSLDVVVKRIEKHRIVSSAQLSSANRELSIHQSLHHRNIVDFLDSGETESDFVLMLEYLPVNDYFSSRLEVNNQPFCTKKDGAVDKLRSFTYDIVEGLRYLHENGVIHMDLKPGNLLLKKDVPTCEYPLVKLCDFGLSRRVEEDGGIVIEKKCGTSSYVAPEVSDQARVTTAVDMWGLGVLLHILAVGFAPFALRWKPGEELKFNPRYWKKYESTGLQDFISRCLLLKPSDRITASQALCHSWLALRRDTLPNQGHFTVISSIMTIKVR